MKLISFENLSKYNELLNQKTVRSVNSIKPDSTGNVSLDVLTTPGNIIKWESDFFDIASNQTYSFDLTGTVFENEERSNINFQLVAKVKNGNDILQAGDTVFTNYNDFVGNTNYTELGSYSYIRDKTLYIHFGNDSRFIVTSCDANSQTQILKTDVQCKIILTKIITGTNGELSATPKSITNIVGVTDNRILGEIFYNPLPLNSEKVHLLDGSILSDATELYDYLESIKQTNPELFVTNEQFEAEVASTGKCNKFVLNTENKTVRIPKGEADNYIVIKSFERTFELNQPFSLLEPKWSDVPLNNPSWLLSNGQENSEENYPSVYQLLLNEYNNGELKTETIDGVSIQYKQLNNGHKVVTDKTAYNSIFVKTGTAWYYLLDLENKTFVLPQTNGYIKFGNSNVFVKESLPNLKGSFAWGCSSGDDNSTAPFERVFSSDYGATSGNTSSYSAKFSRYTFDASTYSSVYQDSAHVNPNSVQGYLYFYVGEFVRNANFADLGVIKDRLDLEVPGIKNDILHLKTNISSYAFPGPKYDMLTIPTSASNLVAPENGWFVYQSFGGGSTKDYIFLRNNINLMYGVQSRDQSFTGLYANIQVKKGEEVYFEYLDNAPNKNLKFIYASDKCE